MQLLENAIQSLRTQVVEIKKENEQLRADLKGALARLDERDKKEQQRDLTWAERVKQSVAIETAKIKDAVESNVASTLASNTDVLKKCTAAIEASKSRDMAKNVIIFDIDKSFLPSQGKPPVQQAKRLLTQIMGDDKMTIIDAKTFLTKITKGGIVGSQINMVITLDSWREVKQVVQTAGKRNREHRKNTKEGYEHVGQREQFFKVSHDLSPTSRQYLKRCISFVSEYKSKHRTPQGDIWWQVTGPDAQIQVLERHHGHVRELGLYCKAEDETDVGEFLPLMADGKAKEKGLRRAN